MLDPRITLSNRASRAPSLIATARVDGDWAVGAAAPLKLGARPPNVLQPELAASEAGKTTLVNVHA